VNETNFQTDGLSLAAASQNCVVRLCLDSLVCSLHLIALKMRIFDLCLLALTLIFALDCRFLFPDHLIQVLNRIFFCQSKSDK